VHPSPTEPTELSRGYEFAAVEARRYAESLAGGVFHEEPDPARPAFVISMPPPNITGRAHLGHASTYTAMDVLARYHRMLGENAVWLPGQDHAAIATEAVLVRELKREGLTRDGLGRDAFLARAWAWRERYGDEIYDAFRRLGFGPDWERDRFTLDPGLSAAVAKVFVALYREGLIYRGTRLVNWDVASQSTLSDAEVDDVERDGFLWYLTYRASDGEGGIEIATTRPETILGDIAIAVHPEDERYANLIGRTVLVPIIGRTIPVVADAAIDRAFGTGALKVTPGHDVVDYEIGERHALPMPSVIGFDGKICAPQWHRGEPHDHANEAAAVERMSPYLGLDRDAVRTVIVADLERAGALIRTEPRRHNVPVSSRSGAVVEPLLSLQWFCRMESLAAPALAAYRDGRIRFVPERFGRTYAHWLENVRDWNVSRQVWWGHRLPVWYAPDGTPIVAETEAEALAIAARDHGTTELVRDPDTLDTWFSSGLWPFSILDWPAQTPELAHWYPNSVLVTGREIIFLWVARMVMLGLHVAGEIPFHDVFVAPLVFDLQGRKMSKSLGNVVDPIDLIATYGADALRFGILRQMRLESQELRFDERLVAKARDFNTKLWNALRYVRSLPEGITLARKLPAADELGLADAWILVELRATIERVSGALDAYEFGVAADAVLEFAWYRYCDWYLEATKLESPARAIVLPYVLSAIARLLHPFAPFVSEEIWQHLPHDGRTIVTASWPDAEDITLGDAIAAKAARYERVRTWTEQAREQRAALKIAPRERVEIPVPAGLPADERALLALHAQATLVDTPVMGTRTDGTFGDTGHQQQTFVVRVNASPAALRTRYASELARLGNEVARGEKKLADDRFTSRASPDVVAKEREKLAAYGAERERVAASLASLTAEDGA